jgi:signal transduction histidine kinase
MQERVALLGGVVEVESRPGQGTMIRARIHVPN